MNPSDPNQSNNQQPGTWFDTLPSPAIPATPKTNANKSKRIIIGALLLLVGAGVITAFLLLRPQAALCLTADDYELFTGQAADPQMSVKENFYTTSLTYTNKTAQYTDVTKEEDETQIKIIGQLFKYRSPNSSMVVTLSGQYTPNDTAQAASQRIANLKQALIKSGVDESAIKVKQPTAIIDDGELSANSEELATAKTYVTITSDTTCRSQN